MKAFISYSHNDSWALDQLHIHMAMLRRENKIGEWFDREILAGGDLDREISKQLEDCDLFLPLISPDFLASDYCYEREMKRALERHEAGDLRVIPIIVEPCDWKSSSLKKLKAIPRDGLAITEWTNHNNAFMDIIAELRRVLTTEEREDTVVSVASGIGHTPVDRRYRVKRDFDEIDKKDFRDQSFAVISAYFQAAIIEIDSIDGLRGRFDVIGPQSFRCTVVNKGMESGTAHITVHSQSSSVAFGDIYFSFSENAPTNTSNGGFSIESDEYDLFLQPNMFSYSSENERLSAEAAANNLWTQFIEQAGVSHD